MSKNFPLACFAYIALAGHSIAQDFGLYSESGAYIGLEQSDEGIVGSMFFIDETKRLIEVPTSGRFLSEGSALMLGIEESPLSSRTTAVYTGSFSQPSVTPYEWTLKSTATDLGVRSLTDYGQRSDAIGKALAGILIENGLSDDTEGFGISASALAHLLPVLKLGEEDKVLGFAPIQNFAVEAYSKRFACLTAEKVDVELDEAICDTSRFDQIAIVAPQAQSGLYKLLADKFDPNTFASSPLGLDSVVVTSTSDALIAVGKSTNWSFTFANFDMSSAQTLTEPMVNRRRPFLRISSPPETFFHTIRSSGRTDAIINSEVQTALATQSATREKCRYYDVDSEPVIACMNHSDDFGMHVRPFWILSNYVMDISFVDGTDKVDVVAGTYFLIRYGNSDAPPRTGVFAAVDYSVSAEASAVGFVIDRFSSLLRNSYPNMEVR